MKKMEKGKSNKIILSIKLYKIMEANLLKVYLVVILRNAFNIFKSAFNRNIRKCF